MNAEVGIHPSDGRSLLHVETQAERQAWLEQNHERSGGVWLVSWNKATCKPSVPYADSVEEALSFGWADSRSNRLGEDPARQQIFIPRNPGSPWFRINEEKAERLALQGRMTAASIALIDVAKSNDAWAIYDEIDDQVIPHDLACALARNNGARAYFDNFPASSRKDVLWWIKSSRKPEIRAARIFLTVELAAENRMAITPRAVKAVRCSGMTCG